MNVSRLAGLVSCLVVLPLLCPTIFSLSFVPDTNLGGINRQSEDYRTFSTDDTQLEPGKIIEKVTTSADPSQSFALYLPSTYTPSKKWPIIYGFDPGARGRLPVEQFKDAAEKYGYIIVGSNSSRNGPALHLKEIVINLWQETHSRFQIDDQRVYTTGLSGGARVACSVGYMLNGYVAGVIGCGAGFPQGTNPSKATPFVYFGTVGIEDFNFPEMTQLEKALDSASIPNRLAVFDGGHEWAPPSVCIQAIEWMEIQAMKSRKRLPDDALIDSLFKREIEKAKADDAANKPYEAYVGFSQLSREFKGLRDVNEFETRADALRNTKEVKDAIKLHQREEAKQQELEQRFFTLRSARNDSDQTPSVTGNLSGFIQELKKTSEEKENTSNRLVARRALLGMSIFISEESSELMANKEYGMAISNFKIATELRPDSPGPFYNLARAYSLSRDKKKAIEALKKAQAKGFTNVGLLESKDFDFIREDNEFKNILTTLKGKQH
jgi:tetratricopeptide (TPR) repeat protein